LGHIQTRTSYDLADILPPDNINPDCRRPTVGSIDELIENLVKTDKIKPEHREAIGAVVKKREST